MSARNLTALGFSVGMGVITGVYIFRPMLQEQQKAGEFWRDPGEAKMGSAADDTNLRQQDLKTRPPVGPSRGQGQGEGQDE